MQKTLSLKSTLVARKVRAKAPPLAWRLKNVLRVSFLWAWLCHMLAYAISRATGLKILLPSLSVILIRANGEVINYGVVSRRLITDAGVAFLADDLYNGSTDISNMKYHASGTGVGAEAVGDTALGAEATTITDRATGTQSKPAANQVKSEATQTFTGSGAITEHGMFSVITEGLGTLWDRSVFAAINVVPSDTIVWAYTLTISSGG